MSEHVLGSPYQYAGRWKIGCHTCDYWTGYTSRNKAEKAAAQHVKAMKDRPTRQQQQCGADCACKQDDALTIELTVKEME